MSPRRVLLGALALLAAALLWFLSRNPGAQPERAAPSTAGAAASRPNSAAAQSTPSARERAATDDRTASPLARELNSPAGTIQADLRIVLEVVDAFRTNFPRDGNPVGSNAEITAALTGKNKLRYAVIPPNPPAINRDGELCDRWGTPFFFHAESARRMEVRSAGPDRRLWTDDDVVLAP